MKEKIYLINLAGIGLGLIGAVVIIGLGGIFDSGSLPQSTIGNLLIILASISFVIGAVLSRKLLDKYPTIIVTAVSFLVGTITFLPPAAREYFQDPGWPGRISMLGGLGLIYMALLSSISAYFLFDWALSKVGIIKADLLQYIEPFVASALAVIILGETITPTFLIGAFLIAIGVFLGTFAKEYHHRRTKFHRH